MSFITRFFPDLDDLSFEKQIQVAMIIPMIPFFIAYSLFFYFVLFLNWGIKDAFSISISFFSVGMIGYFVFRDNARKSITGLETISARIRWSKSLSDLEDLMIRQKIPLFEEGIVRPVEMEMDVPQFENHPQVEEIEIYKSRKTGMVRRRKVLKPLKIEGYRMGLYDMAFSGNPHSENSRIESILAGKYGTECILTRRSYAPNGVPYKRLQLVHFFPAENDLYPNSGQFIVSKAQFLEVSSGVIDVTFLYWGERTEPIPVFLITSSPELTQLIQESIGIVPALKIDDDNATFGKELKSDIEAIMKLGDTTEALTYAFVLKGRTQTLEGLIEAQVDIGDLASAQGSTWERNRQIIREQKSDKWSQLKNSKVIIGILAFVFFGGLIYWLMF